MSENGAVISGRFWCRSWFHYTVYNNPCVFIFLQSHVLQIMSLFSALLHGILRYIAVNQLFH